MKEIKKLILNYQDKNGNPIYSYEYGNLPNIIPAIGDEVFMQNHVGKVIRRVISYKDETVFIIAIEL